ncbi:MAG: archease [Anaerolineae bacterium]|nr:archease [Anaerolineae bacterium]
MNGNGFEEVPHTADVALRVWGHDLAELFVNAARGMTWLLADPDTVAPTVEVPLELDADDAEVLLVTWLGELLYLNERDGLVFTAFTLKQVTPTHLVGQARGGVPKELRTHIKAVTFNEMDIRPAGRGLETMVVFDV